MAIECEIRLDHVYVQQLYDKLFEDAAVNVDVLRLDRIHPVVSGNKWFKLKYHLQHASKHGYRSIATFGGTFSNHIVAAAYACDKQHLECTGYIRGERPKHLSQTLRDAQALNMHLEFLSRKDFTNKRVLIDTNPGVYFIPEGGYGDHGVKGAAEILRLVPNIAYKYIVCAVGTGTMLAGIGNASLEHQQCMGISVMKNNFSLEGETRLLLKPEVENRVNILHDYHFGGYAKYTGPLIDFMNKIWLMHQLPLDFVYTAKSLFAIYDLIEKKFFDPGDRVLFVHSGGLQGNRSLPAAALCY